MPELPEVETIRRQLEKLIVGKTISSIEVLNTGSFRAEKNSFIGKTIRDVGRKGKVLVLSLIKTGVSWRSQETPEKILPAGRHGGIQNLYIHLKMSGQLGHKVKGRRQKEERRTKNHLRVIIRFTDQSELEFHDQRKFGWISGDPAVLPRGIDALDPKLTPEKLAEILRSSNRPIKTILLDQSKIAGIGNIYASEILWQAGISPFRKGVSLPKQGDSLSEISEKFRKLHAAIREVLTDAIDSGGSTMDDQLYRHVSGQTGNYWSRRQVYDRAGQPCRRSACRKKNTVIQKTVIGHRSTYFCPACQTQIAQINTRTSHLFCQVGV